MTLAQTESKRELADLMIFHEIARALTSSLDLESILAAIMRQMQRHFRPETWNLMLMDEERKDLYCVIADGQFGSHLHGSRIPYGEGMAGWVAERGEILLVPKVTPETALDPGLQELVRSAVCIPLRARQRTLGVIQLFNCPPDTFSNDAISFLLVLCDFAAIAIENARTFERVHELTIIDECTGLYNLRHWHRTLADEVARCERLGMSLSLIFIDLDHFKLVNDHYGHQVGSQLLAAVASTIKSHIRTIDLPFRYGGDEFIVLLPGTSKRKAVSVANRLLEAFRTTNHPIHTGLRLNARASLGISTYPDDGKTGQQLLRAVDARMYSVKGTTRDSIAWSEGKNALELPA
jgi:diguanylate cyclase (GGDEF)-like protein